MMVLKLPVWSWPLYEASYYYGCHVICIGPLMFLFGHVDPTPPQAKEPPQ